MRLIRYLAFKIVVSVAENMGPSTRVGDTVRRKRRASEINSGEGDIGKTKWACWSLGIGREVEGFVAVVGGKGGDNRSHYHT